MPRQPPNAPAPHDALQRRVYRLALMLTGDPSAAADIVIRVIYARNSKVDPDAVDSAHLDRMTILRCREYKRAVHTTDTIPPDIAAAVRGLSRQQCEAWTLRDVYRMPPREVARAMDCSTTATQRHYEQAVEKLDQLLKDDDQTGTDRAADVYRAWTMAIGVPEKAQRRIERIKRRRSVGKWLMWLAVAAALVAAGGFVILRIN